VLGPLAGAIVLDVVVHTGDPVRTSLLGGGALVSGAAFARRVAPQAALLPLMRRVYWLVGPALGLALLGAIELLTGRPHAGPLALLAAGCAGVFVSRPWAPAIRGAAPGSVRIAFIGPGCSAARLARALEAGGSTQYALVGRVRCPGEPPADSPPGAEPASPAPPALGWLSELGRIVADNDIDVLAMGAEAPRLAVFEQLTDSCLALPVRLVELAALIEEVFGHVPTADINAAWFQCLASPHARVPARPLKCAFDLVASIVLLLLTLPLLLVLVVLVRRDSGPGLFMQVRVGEGGRPFRLHKLRTMHVGADRSAQWASLDDPRVTRVGVFLRRSHLDELPQLVNVIRGEMSLVGPRPEQPEFVDRLERMLPFYQRRHLIRPGVTGWAQIRCGYAGSDIGSAWKLCHDLYYVKHRSLGLDLLILCETLATPFFHREPVMRQETIAYVLADDR
jgi:lipopolysaccharide/colanic/teichoic acid biosynthesis glycosyltransferase